MIKKYDILVILGGSLINDNGKWRTANYNEGDNFGATGDSVRVIAGSYLFKHGLADHIIVSCGPGQYKDRPEIPNVALIMKQELIELGVPAEKIEIENKSNNTYQQLKAAQAISKQRKLKSVGIVSNKWHLPRIQTMIDHGPDMDNIREFTELIDAEDVLLYYAPDKWRKIIEEAYKSKGIKQRMALEQKGIQDILEGRYVFKPSTKEENENNNN